MIYYGGRPVIGFGIANPAAENCVAKGGASQNGICMFPNGSQCDEWALYRGECKPSVVSTTTSSSKRPLIGLVVGAVAGGLVGAFVQQPIGTILGTMVGGFGGLMVGVGVANAAEAHAPHVPGPDFGWHRLQQGDVVKAGQQVAIAAAKTDRTVFSPSEIAEADQALTQMAKAIEGAPVQGAKGVISINPPGTPLRPDWPSDDDLGVIAYRALSNVLVDPPADFVQRLTQTDPKLIVEAWVR